MSYVRFHDSVEQIQHDEDATVAEILEVFGRLRAFTFEKHRHAIRDAHAKSHGILRGTIAVLGDLPEPFAQGVFREPREYPVIARYSTAPGDILPDGVAGFRGLSLKLLDVPGPKLARGFEEAVTQDFLFINIPAIPTGDVAEYLRAMQRMEKIAHAPEGVQEAITTVTRIGGAVLRKVGVTDMGVIGQGMAQSHILGETFFTSAPLRHGDYIARLSAVPVAAAQRPLVGETVDTSNDSVLRDLVTEYFRGNGAEYEIRAQLNTNLETMPIEDASIAWNEDESPFVPVARLTIPAQDAFSPARRVYADDVLTFNPWQCIAEHRPLGSIMRSRRQAYEASSNDRHARNARQRVEPSSIDELPE